MTKTASNVLFAYWSHDIGGFRKPKTSDPPANADELMVRWVQFGAVSPMFRTHGVMALERRVWKWPGYALMADAMKFRARLAPYLYTTARAAYETGVGILRPMYYAWPEEARAYEADLQYMLGDALLVRPVVKEIPEAAQAVSVDIWLPREIDGRAGRWVDWNSSAEVMGDDTHKRVLAKLSDLPLFVKAGAVLPLLPPGATDATDSANVHWCLMPGSEAGEGERYDDAGDTNDYNEDGFIRQRLSYTLKHASDEEVMTIRLSAVVGAYPEMADSVHHVLELRGRSPPARATCNGQDLEITESRGHSLALPHGTVLIDVGQVPVSDASEIELVWRSPVVTV